MEMSIRHFHSEKKNRQNMNFSCSEFIGGGKIIFLNISLGLRYIS